MTTAFQGGCLCGAVRYECAAEPMMGGHCQCIDCRRSSGSGHCSHMMVPAAAVTITGKTKLYERKADSGNTVGRAFCPECGAPVYSTNSGASEALFLRASSLDDPDIFEPQVVVYTRSGPVWDHVDPALPAFETIPPDFSFDQS